MIINDYSINGYCWLFMAILIMDIACYFWWILIVINGYYISGY
jgi:hypothetical protein